ncbi:MAG: Gfo/Idh/MocA family oxidoreductase [Caldilineaceae bacterium]|nr:Gfo/Idh/MocA family oxidoreductase [Caldilineaceae bacterium]
MSKQKLRVGVIGAGFMGVVALPPKLQETGRAEVVAVSRRNPERLALAQQQLNVSEGYTDWREMLEKSALDAVLVCTPHDAHVEPTLAALEKGLHVYLEKPMTIKSADAWQLVEAAERADRVLTIGYNNRGNHVWQSVKRLLDDGAIGPLRQINATMCADFRAFWQQMPMPPAFQSGFGGDLVAPGNWRTQPERMGGGMFSDSGSHLQDLLLWLAESSPSQVTALAQRSGDIELSIIDLLARLDNGSSLSITFNATVSGGDELSFYGQGRVTCYGERGAITADWTGIGMGAKEIWVDQDGKRTKVEPDGESFHPVAGFVATVLDGAPNPCPAHEAARAVMLTEAAYRSAETGQMIQVEGM